MEESLFNGDIPSECDDEAAMRISKSTRRGETITVHLTPDEAWALVNGVRPATISGKQGFDLMWVQQRVFAALQDLLSTEPN